MAEIMGHYRSYQILGTLGDALETSDPVASALQRLDAQEVERIFRLLALRWPEFDMHSAYVGVQSQSSRAVRANALEFLDNILKPQVRSLVVPLLDPQVSPARARPPRQPGARDARSTRTSRRWRRCSRATIRGCARAALYAVGMLRLGSLERELDKLPTARTTRCCARPCAPRKPRLAGASPADRARPKPSPSSAEHAWRPATRKASASGSGAALMSVGDARSEAVSIAGAAASTRQRACGAAARRRGEWLRSLRQGVAAIAEGSRRRSTASRSAKSRRNAARKRLTVFAPACGPSASRGAGSSVHQCRYRGRRPSARTDAGAHEVKAPGGHRASSHCCESRSARPSRPSA